MTRLDVRSVAAVAKAIGHGAHLDAERVVRDEPQESWVVTEGGRVTAHESLWWTDTPRWGARRVGAVGHYGGTDESAARRVLAHACARLAAEGCDVAIGPMDGSTWRRYRAVTERGDVPSFFLDVDTPARWARDFEAAGFERVAEYASAVTDAVDVDPRVAGVRARLERLGIRIRQFDVERACDELRAIHALSSAAFARAFLYSPITSDAFIAQYRDALQRVDPRLVLVAEHDDRVVGFVFAVPDVLEAARDGAARTVVLKTLAAWPDRRYAGLGAWLADEIHGRARRLGFDRVVHALMHVSNVSRVLSARWHGRVIRRYALYGRELSR